MSFTDAPGASPDRPLTGAALLGLLVLTLAHVAARLWVSPALKWDEGEQMLWSQQLAWGYGAQPPLYTWLQWGFNATLGPSVLALSLLKHTLLALTYLLMALAARQLMPPRAAVWASASMLLIPALGWTSVRDQTHSVLVTCAVAGSWWALLRLWRRPAPAGYALLGFFVALGVLAKYNYALFAGALLLAALGPALAGAAARGGRATRFQPADGLAGAVIGGGASAVGGGTGRWRPGAGCAIAVVGVGVCHRAGVLDGGLARQRGRLGHARGGGRGRAGTVWRGGAGGRGCGGDLRPVRAGAGRHGGAGLWAASQR